ncbi:MAG TPA: hypothetical protein VGE88_07945 [Lysobacter sp.]
MSLPSLAQSSQADVEQRFTPTEMHEAGLDTLSPAQLAALNRLLREKVASPTTSSASAPSRTDDEANHSYIGLDDKPMHSRVTGTVEGWEPGTVFVLENGQQWKVLKGAMKLRKPLQAPEIVVVPGIAGRWFLQVDEDMPKARVYRID